MSYLETEVQSGISILRFSRGVTNAMSVEFVRDLERVLEEIIKTPRVRALLLTSSNDKFFSIGLDIPQLIELPGPDFRDFYHSFTRTCLNLLTMPIPVVAAIPGHAIAGGCIIALSCDYRLMAEGQKWIGLNEVKLGLPVPYLAAVTLMNLVGNRAARDIMDEGEFCSPAQALKIGLVDEVVPGEELIERAMERLERMIKNPSRAYALIKQTRVNPMADQIREGMEEIEKEFIDCWNSPQTQQLLKEAIEKF